MEKPQSNNFSEMRCKPCEGGVEPLTLDQVEEYLRGVVDWKLCSNGSAIEMTYRFKTFAKAMVFLNKVAEIAELEQHHPDLHLTKYSKVRIDLTTHAIGGLSINDFILAAKIDECLREIE